MQPDLLDIILIGFGLFTLYGVLVKPAFYWNRGRIERTRKIIGDRNTTLLYLIVGALMLLVGAAGAFGLL